VVKEEFEKEMEWFVSYYGFDLTKHMAPVWLELLKNYTAEQLHRALMQHIRDDEQPFFPAFGKINQQLSKFVRPIQ